LAALEEQQGGNAADLILEGDVRVVVDVQLADRDLPRIFRCERVDGRREALAGPAPLGPEVHQHRRARLEHTVVEVAVRESQYVFGRHVLESSLFSGPVRSPSGPNPSRQVIYFDVLLRGTIPGMVARHAVEL